MEPKVIHEERDYLIVNKPSGWITNNAATTGNTPVLQTWIEDNLKFEISDNENLRNGIVHRLDKETSGLLIIAKNEKAFRGLQGMFKERMVQKTYIALVHGKLQSQRGSVNAPTGRLPWNRERFGVFPGGKNALTDYQVSDYFKKDNIFYTLVEVYPKTGRTHQIRVHMKYLGHPIVSDSFYAGRKTSRNDRKWCPRLFLHAQSISFPKLAGSRIVYYTSELPKDLDDVLLKIKE